jgi:plastocyanin
MRNRLTALRAVAKAALVFGMGGAILAPPAAEAIPAFARKYRTSCQTCHTAYPKLNPFGQAYRLRGYRMPDETEDMIKETPVPLGAPGYKKLWPDAVWPGDIPGTVPLSLSTDFTSVTTRTTGEDGAKETIKNDFVFPEEVALLSGGTLGETISFFGEVIFVQEVADGAVESGVEVEHAQIHFNGPFGWGTAFNLKIGRMIPELGQWSGHGAVLVTGDTPAVIGMFNPIGPGGGAEVGGEHHGGGIALPHSVDGLEAYGIVKHRFTYSAGLSNGIGPGSDSFDGNNAKDVFGRIAFKAGGLPFDGEGYVPSDKNWRERSLELGVFAYRGDGKDIFFPAEAHGAAGDHGGGEMGPELLEDRTFYRFGVDLNLYVQDLNLVAGYVHGRDDLATYKVVDDEPSLHESGRFSYDAWFVEGDYVFLPWLHGAVRYEWLRPANREAPDFKRITPNLTALIRANVKALVQYEKDLGESDDYVLVGEPRVSLSPPKSPKGSRMRVGLGVASMVVWSVGLAIPAAAETGSVKGTVTAKGLRSAAGIVVSLRAPGLAVSPPAKPVEMDQKKMQFLPHVLAVVKGTTVSFKNSDPVPHNVFSPEGKYNLGTWPTGETRDHRFDEPGVFTQLCRVHPEMEGFIVVLETPHFAVTDASGAYEIAGVAPGKYKLAAWSEKLKSVEQDVTVEAGTAATVDLTLAR